MPDQQFIPRKTETTGEANFDSLRREGFALIQDLSGDIWTDYNVHDPGVTILEQLCYALTDLSYRTGFPVEDYLTDEDGQIHFERLALHPPEVILPCRPTTAGDYRRVICDAIDGIANVWLTRTQDPAHRGLYRIIVRLNPDIDSKTRADAVASLRRVYDHHRNLCEDLESISILREIECDVHAEVEIAGGRSPADILAEIYFECSRRMINEFNRTSFEAALKDGQPLEEIFRGPLTSRGLIKEDEAYSNPEEVHTADLFSIVKAIEGVENIRNIILNKPHDQGNAQSGREWPGAGYRLHIPQEGEACTVKLIRDGKVLPIRTQEVRARYTKLTFQRLARNRTAQNLAALFPRPQGKYRNLQEYSSIQSQFPAIYGINRYGVPASAAPEVKAKAAQLKGYLLLFEQIMANYLANLHHLRTLFSSDRQPKRSYFFQALDNDAVPGIESLYVESPAEVLARIFKMHDRYTDRKGRLLDYLLALHGETFTQNSLRHFNYYYTPQEVEDVINDNKTAFLNNIVGITRDRGGGFNYRELSWNTGNISGLMRRVSLLLGFPHQMTHSLTMGILKEGLKLIPHDTYARVKAGTFELKLIDLDDIHGSRGRAFEAIPVTGMDRAVKLRKIRRDIKPVVPLRHNVLSEALLRGGIDMERYRLGSLTGEDNYQLVFQPEGEEQWWYLGAYPNKAAGVQSANSICRFLKHLNVESEGMHIVEHLLLRPVGKAQHEELPLPNGLDFYSFRLSVIFPDWTARCHNPNFRMLAEETVRMNCPAHLYPEYYWLGFDQMCTFELLYKKWLDVRCGEEETTDAVNDAARAVILFLLEQRGANGDARKTQV